jgi:hypothetical protein
VCWDLACGTGVYADTIRQLGWTPIGTDRSIAQLRHAATRMPVAVADATRLVVRPSGIPAVISVLSHTDVEDYAAVCRTAATALAAGGRFAHVGVHPCFCGAFVDRSTSEQLIITPGLASGSPIRDLVTPRRAGPGRGNPSPAQRSDRRCDHGRTHHRLRHRGGRATPDVLAIRAHKPRLLAEVKRLRRRKDRRKEKK